MNLKMQQARIIQKPAKPVRVNPSMGASDRGFRNLAKINYFKGHYQHIVN